MQRHRVLIALVLTLAACRSAGPEATSAVEVGIVGQSAAIDGRDGGGSAILWGRSYWHYGDTVLTVPDEYGQNWHHNSYSITDDLDPRDGIDGFIEPLDPAGAPRHLIPPSPSEQAFNAAHWNDENGECDEQPCGARWAVWPGASLSMRWFVTGTGIVVQNPTERPFTASAYFSATAEPACGVTVPMRAVPAGGSAMLSPQDSGECAIDRADVTLTDEYGFLVNQIAVEREEREP